MAELARRPEGVSEPGLEEAIHARGHDLLVTLRAAGGESPRRDAITDRITAWAMRDEALKAQLFRFIDVLPALRSADEVARHLREYLLAPRLHLPPGVAGVLRASERSGAVAAVVARTARLAAHQMARRFIAGSNIDEAVQTILRLRRQGVGFSLDLLGEAVTSEAEAQAYQGQYLGLLTSLAEAARAWEPLPRVDDTPWGPAPRVNVSIKLTSLYSQFDPLDADGTVRAVAARLRPILRQARAVGAYVHVDMEQYATKNLVLRIFCEVLTEPDFRDWPDVGIVIQAYLRDSERDLHNLRAWAERRGTPVWVRLVKGAYWDYETVIAAQKGWPVPVYTEKWETDANFERLTRFLLENERLLHPAIASHNVRSVAHALALAARMELPAGSVEYQVLFGMGDRLGLALAERGERVRVYVPYGELLPGMAYLVRRLLENTSNESFLRHSFTEHLPEAVLLANPLQGKPEAPPMRTIPAPTGDGKRARAALRPHLHVDRGPFRNEPETDFSRAESRKRLAEAIGWVRGRLGARYPLVIDGREVWTDAVMARPNPSRTAELVGVIAAAGAREAEAAVAAARVAFSTWRDTPVPERAGLLFRTADILRHRRFELAAWEVLEVGKPWREADADVVEAVDFLEYYGREMLRLSEPRRRDIPGERNEYLYEPRGVAAIIAPWNFPLAILTGMAAAALVAGNTVILKPAEQSSVVAYRLWEALRDAGAPRGVVHYLPGRGEEVGPVLVEHPDVSLIAFTGSKEVGLGIQEAAARVRPGQRDIKRVIAELGGKNAIIIDDDADLDEAVPGVLASGFGYQGQKCSACSRVIVLASIYDAFIERLAAAARSVHLRRAEDPETLIGPVVDAEARSRILRYLNIGRSEGQVLVELDPGPLAAEGFYVPPTIFTGVDPHACIAQEEIFGPLLAVMKVKGFDEALQVADNTLYALTGGLYSRSPARIARARREMRVGNLYINRKITGAQVDRQPFGGFRMSGIGSKAGGPDYLPQFLVPRAITEATLRRGFAPEVEV